MTARIKISQAGLSAGVAGRSRTDGLATGALVTLEDVSGTGRSTFHLLWGPPEDTTAEASLAATVDPDIWTFSPTAAAYGSYEVELRESGVPVERRIFGVRTPANHLLIPALNERASRHAAWDNDGADQIDLCEQNANDFPLTVLNSFRYAGWWRSLYELYRVVEFGIGSIADNALALVKLVTVPAKSFLVNASNAVGNVATLAGSAAYQYPRVNSANNGLEMATLAAHGSTSVPYDGGTNTFQRGALTGAVTSGQNSNATAFGSIAAKSVLLNATNASASPTGSAPAAPLKNLRSNAAFTALEWASEAGAVELSANTVTNSVASIDISGTLVIPANTLAVGSRYRFTGSFRFTRGATATALNLMSDLDLGGTVLTTPAIAANVSNGFSGSVKVDGEFTIASTGAGGTARAHIIATSDCDNGAPAGKVVTNFNAALSINTTIANNVRLLGRMSLAVAATTILANGGDVVPVN
jgi:hypothetical protein